MKLHDSPMLSFNRPPPVHTSMGAMTSSLPLDPWLSSPLSSATPVHSIPGFMGPTQGLQPSYPSHSFLNSTPHPHSHPPHPHSHPHPSMGHGMQSMAPPPYQCTAPYPDKYPLEDVDQRSSSIAVLRMKAKEHLQSMDKTWHPMWLKHLAVHVNDIGRVRCWSCVLVCRDSQWVICWTIWQWLAWYPQSKGNGFWTVKTENIFSSQGHERTL